MRSAAAMDPPFIKNVVGDGLGFRLERRGISGAGRQRRQGLSFSDAGPRRMRCTPEPRFCARLEESVRELTPIQEISDERRPYSIFGHRFMTTLKPASSASFAASSLRTMSCIQIICGLGRSVAA